MTPVTGESDGHHSPSERPPQTEKFGRCFISAQVLEPAIYFSTGSGERPIWFLVTAFCDAPHSIPHPKCPIILR